MGKRKAVTKPKSVAGRDLYQPSGEQCLQPAADSFETESVPRQRGRPRKTPVEDIKEESVGSIISKALHLTKANNKSVITHMNGFYRSIKADGVMSAFKHEGELVLGIRFKGRKLPQFVYAHEVKIRAPNLFIQYYFANLVFPKRTAKNTLMEVS